ncbi:MAG: DUF1445 domain-containing protein [Rhizobiaceae bacterium]|nr:DUF1445 domain-containing protein [Rhizobiaceae bacterium]
MTTYDLTLPHEPPDDKAAAMTPEEVRLACRSGSFRRPTRGAALGWVHCNLVILHRRHAYDFLLYCQRNRKACPVLEVTDPGMAEPRDLAPGCDLRTDLARYAVFEGGERREDRSNISNLWTQDSVAFLIGSGISFDGALERAGVQTRRFRWIVNTEIETVAAGPFSGKLVATMRWLTPAEAIIATEVSSRFQLAHGAPIHIGDPDQIGADLEVPILGDPVGRPPDGYIPVFWACGVTPHNAALNARLDLLITHAPAHGLPVDLQADRLAVARL